MEYTKCKKRLDLSLFSYKNIEDKIYYLYCDNCREKKIMIIKKFMIILIIYILKIIM